MSSVRASLSLSLCRLVRRACARLTWWRLLAAYGVSCTNRRCLACPHSVLYSAAWDCVCNRTHTFIAGPARMVQSCHTVGSTETAVQNLVPAGTIMHEKCTKQTFHREHTALDNRALARVAKHPEETLNHTSRHSAVQIQQYRVRYRSVVACLAM